MKIRNALVAALMVQAWLALSSGMSLSGNAVAGGKEFKGAPGPVPQAVLFEQVPISGKLDSKVRALIREEAAADLSAGSLTGFLERKDGDRLSWCLEYSDAQKFSDELEELHALLGGFSGVTGYILGSCSK